MRPALLAALLLAACAGDDRAGVYSGTVEFPDAEVGSLVGGRVVRVPKDEGDEADAGAVLVELETEEWESVRDESRALAEATARELDLLLAGTREEEIARAEAEARRLELQWEVVKLGAREEEIQEAREDVAAAEALLQEADADLEREKLLLRRGSTTAERVEDLITRRETARARKAAAEQRLRLLQRGARPEEVEAARQAHLAQKARLAELRAGPRPEEIAAKRAKLDAARARIRLAESKLRELVIRAPARCRVQTLDVRPGDLIEANRPVGVVLLLDEPPWVTVHVPEGHLAKVSVGQEAEIRPDGHPPLRGRVIWISREAEFTPRNVQTRAERVTQVFRVKVEVQGDASRLKDGMWADVELR